MTNVVFNAQQTVKTLINVSSIIASEATQVPVPEVAKVDSPTINKMSAIRSALAFYHGDHKGNFPLLTVNRQFSRTESGEDPQLRGCYGR